MTTEMKMPNPQDYLDLVKANDIDGAEKFLVDNFGVIGKEGFQEEAYNQFEVAVISLVNEQAKAVVEAAKKEATEEVAKEETKTEEATTDAVEVSEAATDSETTN